MTAIEVTQTASVSATDRRWRRIVLLLVLGGSICRLAQFLSHQAYWHDEALLVLNIRDKSFAALLGHLDQGQAAPALFLFLERALLLCLGNSEWVLRVLPLLASIIGLTLFAVVAWRVLQAKGATVRGPAVAFAVALLALSERLIWHAAEVKQYSGDVFCAVLILYLTIGTHRPRSDIARFAILSIISAVLIWFSFTMLFVFAAVSMAMMPRMLRNGGWRRLAYLGGNALVAASFWPMYRLSINSHDPFLDHFWSEDFVDWSHPLRIPFWFLRKTYALCDHPYVSLGWALMLLILLGIHSWRRNRCGFALAMCLLPVGVTLLAAALHRYPYTGERVTVFLLPGLFLLAGAGFQWLMARVRNWAWLAALPLLASGFAQSGYHLITPRTVSDIRPAVQYIRLHRKISEPIYVVNEEGAGATDAMEFFCYWPDPPGEVHHGIASIDALNCPRFWLAFPFQPRRHGWHSEPMLDRIRKSYRQIDQSIEPSGGAALLFERMDEGS